MKIRSFAAAEKSDNSQQTLTLTCVAVTV